DVVQTSIIRLGDDGQPPRLQHVLLRDFPFDDRVAHDADAVRVRDADGSLEVAAFLHPRGAGHLTVAVEREPGREHRIGVRLAARVDDRDPGAHRTLAYHELAAAGDESRVSDFDAGDVGDRVERTGRSADGELEIVLARLGLGPRGSW